MSLDVCRDFADKCRKQKISFLLLCNLPGGEIQVFNEIEITELPIYKNYLLGIAAEMEKEQKEFEKFLRAEMKKEEKKLKKVMKPSNNKK